MSGNVLYKLSRDQWLFLNLVFLTCETFEMWTSELVFSNGTLFINEYFVTDLSEIWKGFAVKKLQNNNFISYWKNVFLFITCHIG